MNSEQIIYNGCTLNVDSVREYMGGLGELPKITLECTPAADDSFTKIAESYKKMANSMYGVVSTITAGSRNYTCVMPRIKKVIFNDPATIVFWKDGTKTVVKCGDSEYGFDPEKGLAMAIAKRALGNEGNYYNEIRKWVKPYCDEYEEETAEKETASILDVIAKAVKPRD